MLGAYSCKYFNVNIANIVINLQVMPSVFILAVVLLLSMEEIDAFICFANHINRPMQMAFFSVDQPMVKYRFLIVRNHLDA